MPISLRIGIGLGDSAGLMPTLLIGNTRRDGDLHKQLGKVQHRFHGGPGWFVGREKLAVLLVVGRQVLTSGQMRQHRQNIIERTSGCLQNHFDALDGVARLLAHVSADFACQWVPAGLTGDEHQIAETRG